MAADFRAIAMAKRIILTPSTFGWWAAWLSSATEVHWPGILKWHPLLNMTTSFVASRPHQLVKTGKAKALWVNETRYIYHDVMRGQYFQTYDDFMEPYFDATLCDMSWHHLPNPYCRPSSA
mmetsp:Transcript_7209/g.26524  ORF Transcript_7209/g.26524 Transcript_7209/m.26524 type:complete len:121 (+) Transcript_7209:192-554(+)